MIYVTADLHGIHPEKFRVLLAKAEFSDDDFLFILGDVIDRGEYGAELLTWLTQQPNIQLILGNHEALLLSCAFLFADVNEDSLNALTVENMKLVQNWVDNGGNPTMKGFRKLLKQDPELVQGILEYLQDCPLYEEVEVDGREYVLVHAGLGENFTAEKPLDAYDANDLLFARPELSAVYYPHKTVIFGHTPSFYYGETYRGKPVFTETWINIDTGVYAGNSPVLLCLDNQKEYYQ